MDNENINYFYAGRIYQYYLDNKEELFCGRRDILGFLVPKTKDIKILKLKQMVKGLVEKDGVYVKCSILKSSGWKIKIGLVS